MFINKDPTVVLKSIILLATSDYENISQQTHEIKRLWQFDYLAQCEQTIRVAVNHLYQIGCCTLICGCYIYNNEVMMHVLSVMFRLETIRATSTVCIILKSSR